MRSTRKLGACAAAAAALAAAIPISASASPVPGGAAADGLEDGENITVVHNIDFIAAFGVGTLGQSVTVEAFRRATNNGLVLLGTATGPLVDTPEGPGIEVNHGPLGSPQPGDCWETFTPDVVPYDLVRVTNNISGDIDEVLIDDITLDSTSVDPATGEAHYRGFAISAATGLPLPAAMLDSGFWRTTVNGADARGESPVVEVATDGQYVARWQPPNFGQFVGANQASAADVASADRQEFGYGHVPPAPPAVLNIETQLADGVGSSPGPALGCDAPGLSPSESNSVRTATPDPLTLSSGALEISGTKMTDASVDVTVSLTDTVGNTVGPLPAVVAAGTNNWTLSVPRSVEGPGNSWDDLNDGVITIRGAFVHGGDSIGGEVLRIRKDLTPPPAPGGGDTGGGGAGGAGGAGAGGAGAGGAAGGSGGTGGGTQVTPIDPATLRVFDLQTRSRVRLRSARRNGVAAAFNVPEGANVVRVELFRVGGAAQNRRLASVTRTVTGGSRVTIRLRSRRVRRQLRTGQYRLVVRTGAGNVLAGRGVVKRLRIVR